MTPVQFVWSGPGTRYVNIREGTEPITSRRTFTNNKCPLCLFQIFHTISSSITCLLLINAALCIHHKHLDDFSINVKWNRCNNHGKRLYMIHYRQLNTVCPNFQLSEFFDFAVGNLKNYSNTNSIIY